ncbi:MAG: sigma 54-interacting transcriptional regulator, partial [Pseudobdellovibrionaceae bacterium]
ELMESCLKYGAQKFLSKPILKDELLLILEKVEALWKLRTHQASSHKTRWIGQSSASLAIQKRIADLKSVESPVLIEGETGTGKEVVARLLHLQEGIRPLITVNLGAISENLFESEFFGHVKGAFTGADQNKVGLVEAANGGDLFLDEIEALPLIHQVKLLRFLENGEVKKVGAKETSLVQVRVIAASNVSLKSMIQRNEFREDLYYRLCANHIQLPPLKERIEDLEELCQHFFSLEKVKKTKSFASDAIASMKKYSWPGNIRELKRICEQLYLTSPLPIIRKTDVDVFLRSAENEMGRGQSTAFVDEHTLENMELELGLDQLVMNFEMRIIELALKKFPEVETAAEVLKVSRSNLYKKMKDYDL